MKRLAYAGALFFLLVTSFAFAGSLDDAKAGLAALDRGDNDTAARSFTQALRGGGLSASDRELALVKRAQAYIGEGRNYLALADLQQALKLDPNDQEAINLRGQAQGSGTRQPSAADNAQSALAYYNRGDTYFKADQYDLAFQDFDQAVRLDPNSSNSSNYYAARGTTYMFAGQYIRAVEDYDQSLRLNPNNPIVYANRGVAKCHLGQEDRATQDFETFHRLGPTQLKRHC